MQCKAEYSDYNPFVRHAYSKCRVRVVTICKIKGPTFTIKTLVNLIINYWPTRFIYVYVLCVDLTVDAAYSAVTVCSRAHFCQAQKVDLRRGEKRREKHYSDFTT